MKNSMKKNKDKSFCSFNNVKVNREIKLNCSSPKINIHKAYILHLMPIYVMLAFFPFCLTNSFFFSFFPRFQEFRVLSDIFPQALS